SPHHPPHPTLHAAEVQQAVTPQAQGRWQLLQEAFDWPAPIVPCDHGGDRKAPIVPQQHLLRHHRLPRLGRLPRRVPQARRASLGNRAVFYINPERPPLAPWPPPAGGGPTLRLVIPLSRRQRQRRIVVRGPAGRQAGYLLL